MSLSVLASTAPQMPISSVEPLQQNIITSTEAVMHSARDVSICPDSIAKISLSLSDNLILRRPTWSRKDYERHFFDGTERTAQWLFILTALNFSFWADKEEPAWEVQYKGETVSGYWALACALKEAQERGVPLTDASFLATIDRNKLKSILGGVGPIPLLDERVHVLQEVGQTLQDLYLGKFTYIIEDAKGSAVKLANTVATQFSTLKDVAQYNGRDVVFLKRAQILAADLWGAFRGESFGEFRDIDHLTIFADYRLPQVLRAMGALVYSDNLSEKIANLEEFDISSPEEIEIRAATIQAVEAIKSAAAARGVHCTALALDWWLWNLSQKTAYRPEPHHRVRTIFY